MAWRSLMDFMGETGIFKGIIPPEATCRIIAGNGKKKSKYKNGLKVLVKEARNTLKEIHDKEMTVGDFVKNFNSFASETEWTLTTDGRFVHYRGPYKKKSKKIVWYTIVQLDLTEWLKDQSPEMLAQVVKCAFEWRADGHEQTDKFYKHLGRTVEYDVST